MTHHLDVHPLGDLVAIIERAAGIDVAILDAGPDEHGLTMRDPARGTVFIGLARTRHPMRQRSTLAHELGHVLFEDWADNGAGDWSERTPIDPWVASRRPAHRGSMGLSRTRTLRRRRSSEVPSR